MSRGRAFFSTIPGIISALAGLVTVIVGVLAITAQLGGDDEDGNGNGSSSGTTMSTLAGGAGGGGGSGGATTPTATGRLSASPTSLKFEVLGAKEATVRVRNEANGPVTLNPPKIEGSDSAQYAATFNCPPSLGAEASCDVKVTFKPTKAGRSTATLLVAPVAGAVRAVEVDIEGNHVL